MLCLIHSFSPAHDIKINPNPWATHRYKVSMFNVFSSSSRAHILIFIIKNQNYFPKKWMFLLKKKSSDKNTLSLCIKLENAK